MKTKHVIISFLILFFFFAGSPLKALTLEDLSIEGGYVLGIPKDSLIEAAKGPGYEISFRWRVSNTLSLLVSSGHWYLAIDQENAHKILDWPYWRQIYGAVVYQADMDPIYDVTIEPRQDLKIKPFELGISWQNSKSTPFQIGGTLSGGYVWYQRQLYIEEFWDKYFPTIDYTFSYDFQNRSDAKKGYLWAVTPAAFASYHLSDAISLSMTVKWKCYFPHGKNADFFPLKNHYRLSCAIHFLY